MPANGNRFSATTTALRRLPSVSQSPAAPGWFRIYPSFSSAVDEVTDASVFAGIHFRAACIEGQFLGAAVGDYVWNRAFQPVSGGTTGQVP